MAYTASKLTYIWRVENGQGAGPYRSKKYGGLLDELDEAGYNKASDEKRPAPEKDASLSSFFATYSANQRKKWCYGFATLAQYKAWFDTAEIRDMLRDNDFFLTQYQMSADLVVKGDKQAVFEIRKSMIVNFRDCHTVTVTSRNTKALTPAMKQLLQDTRTSGFCKLHESLEL